MLQYQRKRAKHLQTIKAYAVKKVEANPMAIIDSELQSMDEQTVMVDIRASVDKDVDIEVEDGTVIFTSDYSLDHDQI